jgi:hypothetical protein
MIERAVTLLECSLVQDGHHYLIYITKNPMKWESVLAYNTQLSFFPN